MTRSAVAGQLSVSRPKRLPSSWVKWWPKSYVTFHSYRDGRPSSTRHAEFHPRNACMHRATCAFPLQGNDVTPLPRHEKGAAPPVRCSAVLLARSGHPTACSEARRLAAVAFFAAAAAARFLR